MFVATNGKRRRRKPVHVAEIKSAAHAGCVFLTDARCRRPEGGNPYNIGEQEVADLLRSLGYRERVEHHGLIARWTPDNRNTGFQCADGGSIPNDSCAPAIQNFRIRTCTRSLGSILTQREESFRKRFRLHPMSDESELLCLQLP